MFSTKEKNMFRSMDCLVEGHGYSGTNAESCMFSMSAFSVAVNHSHFPAAEYPVRFVCRIFRMICRHGSQMLTDW